MNGNLKFLTENLNKQQLSKILESEIFFHVHLLY